MTTAYHFVGLTLRDRRPVPLDGEWLEHAGELIMCEAGLHASLDPFDALQYAPGATLCFVELDGEILSQSDKVVAKRRRIIRRIDATELLREFARACALDVIHLWDAPPIIREYLETGREEIREAAREVAWGAVWEAARGAAWEATREAAWEAAWGVAWGVAWGAYRSQFNVKVTRAFESVTNS